MAVHGGRDVAGVVNELLSLSFALKVATKDFHRADHVSFASNHLPPNNKVYGKVTITNPGNPDEMQEVVLWPDHCVQGTPGAELISELEIARIDKVIEKGTDSRTEMFSAFADPFRNPPVSESSLHETLKASKVTHVYVVGLAMDYCVKCTAIDSAKHGYSSYIVEEGTRSISPRELEMTMKELKEAGVHLIKKDGPELDRIRSLII